MSPTRASATLMTVHVLFFAQLRGRFGADALAVSLPDGSTGNELLQWLSSREPKVEALLAVSRLAVNGEYVSWEHRLRDGDEAAVIPPVSGG